MNVMDNRTVLNIFFQQIRELHVKYTIAQIRRAILLDAVTMHVWFWLPFLHLFYKDEMYKMIYSEIE